MSFGAANNGGRGVLGKPFIERLEFVERLGKGQANFCLELAEMVFSYAREAIVITDPNGRVIRANNAFARITGYGQDEVLGLNLQARGLMRPLEGCHTSLENALAEQGHWFGELWSRCKDGTELTLQLSASAVHDSHGNLQNFVAILSDITHLKKRQDTLERNAHYDALTQLPNRLLLAERMRKAMNKARIRHDRLAVVFIDLDGFKAINDGHGHELGDRVLQILAQRIKATIRDDDTLARLGGDEFVAGLVGLQEPQDCEPVLKRMLRAASAPMVVDGKTLQVSASIGVAFFPEHGQEVDALISKADHAMYLSKRRGGSRLAYCAA